MIELFNQLAEYFKSNNIKYECFPELNMIGFFSKYEYAPEKVSSQLETFLHIVREDNTNIVYDLNTTLMSSFVGLTNSQMESSLQKFKDQYHFNDTENIELGVDINKCFTFLNYHVGTTKNDTQGVLKACLSNRDTFIIILDKLLPIVKKDWVR